MGLENNQRQIEREKREYKRRQILSVSSWGTMFVAMAGFFGLWYELSQSNVTSLSPSTSLSGDLNGNSGTGTSNNFSTRRHHRDDGGFGGGSDSSGGSFGSGFGGSSSGGGGNSGSGGFLGGSSGSAGLGQGSPSFSSRAS